jgi:hypothetical protein
MHHTRLGMVNIYADYWLDPVGSSFYADGGLTFIMPPGGWLTLCGSWAELSQLSSQRLDVHYAE